MKIRTLIVDDDYLIVKSLSHLLTNMNGRFEISGTGSTGTEAYRLICSLKPDLVLLDISMPELDGLGLLKMLTDNRVPLPEIVILSAYRNFSYAQQALHYGCREYLLKPFVRAEIEEHLNRIADTIEAEKKAENRTAPFEPELFSAALAQYLSGSSSSRLDAALSEKRIPCFPIRFCMIEQPDEWQNLPNFIRSINDLFGDTGNGICFPFEDRPALWLPDNCIEKYSGQLSELLSEACGTHGLLVVSPVVHRSEELAGAIKCVRASVILTFYSHGYESPVLYASAATVSKLQSAPAIPDSFFSDIRSGDISSALHLYARYFLDISKSRGFDPDSIRKITYDLVVFLRSVSLPLSPALASHLRNIDFDTVSKNRTLDRLFESVLQILFDMEEDVLSARDKGDRIILLAETYCRKNLAKATLSGAAASVNMSPNYFSRYFKTHNGDNFNDYLTKLRMETAMQFLIQTNMRISEIAGEIGYSTTSHFISIFKSCTGCTPNEYRNQKTPGAKSLSLSSGSAHILPDRFSPHP